VVEGLLLDVVADGFAVYCCGSKTAPRALVACYEWPTAWMDLFTVRNFDRVITARVPALGRSVDIFDPGTVVWAYEGAPQHAVRALLNLVHPAHPDAPTAGYPAPAGLHIPRAQQRPMTILLPSPSQAGVRGGPVSRRDKDPPGVIVAGTLPDLPRHQTAAWPPVVWAAPDARLPAASRPPVNFTRWEGHGVREVIATNPGPLRR
jgi:hypothetical protein